MQFSVPGEEGMNTGTANRIEFHWHPKKNGLKSKEEGREVFDQVPYIKITSPGAKQVVDREVRDEDKREYPRLWAAFEAGEERPEDGQPVEEWPAVNVAQVAELKAAGIFTVEQVANIPDQNLNVLGMQARKLRSKAQAYMALAKGNAPFEQLAAENEQLRADIEIMKQQLAAIGAEATNESTPKKRGRPKKSESEE